jgi:hypothetical protein
MKASASFACLAVFAATMVCVVAVGDAAVLPPDRKPPTKPTVDGPRETPDLQPVFSFGARDNRTSPDRIRFRCAIDSPLLHPCPRAYTVISALTFGRHELRVRALDRAGNQSPVTTFAFTAVGRWDAAEDFRRAPHEENPGHDRYGNTTWFYLYSPVKLHDPTLYRSLPTLAIDGENQWWSFGFRTDHTIIPPLVGKNSGQQFMVFHPDLGQFAILGWRSPYTGRVSVGLQLRFADPAAQAASNGIGWSIDRGGATLQAQVLTPGNTAAWTTTLDVNTGESLYLVIDERDGDSRWDLTVGQFTVQTVND